MALTLCQKFFKISTDQRFMRGVEWKLERCAVIRKVTYKYAVASLFERFERVAMPSDLVPTLGTAEARI